MGLFVRIPYGTIVLHEALSESLKDDFAVFDFTCSKLNIQSS